MIKRSETGTCAVRMNDPETQLVRRVYISVIAVFALLGFFSWRGSGWGAPPKADAPLYTAQATVYSRVQGLGKGGLSQVLSFRIHTNQTDVDADMGVDPLDRQYAQVQIGDIVAVTYQVGPGGQIFVRNYKLHR